MGLSELVGVAWTTEVMVMTLLPEVVTRTEVANVEVGGGGASVVVSEVSDVVEADDDELADPDESEETVEEDKDDTEVGLTVLLPGPTDLKRHSQHHARR